MIRLWQIVCVVPLLAFSLLGGELTFKNVHIRTRTLADAQHSHGYTAHQFELENLSGKKHTVTIQFPSEDHHDGSNITDLRRTVALGPNSRKVVSLYQPPLSIDSYARSAFITVDGETRRLADAFGGHVNSLANLGIHQPAVVLASRSWNGKFASNPTYEVNIAEGLITQWARHWLAYSGFDVVVVRANEWNAAPTEVRMAIVQYVRAGGRLFVLGSITLPPDARKLNTTQLAARQQSASALLEKVNIISVSKSSGREDYPEENMGHEEHEGHKQPGNRPEQNPSAVASSVYTLGWGLIRVLDPTVTEMRNHRSMLEAIENLRSNEQVRMPALSSVMAGARNLHTEDKYSYYQESSGSFDDYFPIVEDSGVPVRLMIVILIGFVVLAGPVNLVLLHKLKRRTWFLWTLPAISILTSAVVFATALLNEGFTPTVRRDVITILDHQSQQATTVGALGIYAPVAPGNLEFSAHTEVTPLLSSRGQDSGSNRGINWTKGQLFTGKWIASRVPAHFAVRKSESRKERLSVTWKSGTPTVVNSLGTDITYLCLADAQGNIFEATHLRAGQRAELQRVAGKQTVINYLNTNFLLSTDKGTPESEYSKNLTPGTYLARLDDSPFMENPIGRGQLKTHAVVLGVLTKSEAGP
jgi:hypothetical protein